MALKGRASLQRISSGPVNAELITGENKERNKINDKM
jgi:hypothetical protein